MKAMAKKFVTTAVIVAFLVSAFAAVNPVQALSGYLQGSQGLDWQYYIVEWNNAYWSPTLKGPLVNGNDGGQPSSRSFGYSLDLDPDGATIGYPDLCASLGSFTMDGSPDKTYSWQIPKGNDAQGNKIYEQVEMYRYK